MEVEEYGGVLAEILDAIADRGPVIRRIFVTPDEMREIQFSSAWRKTVTKYYGTAAPVMDDIQTDRNGNFISFFYENVLVAVGAVTPPGPLDDVDFTEPLEEEGKGSTTFTKDNAGTGNKDMLVGTGNPSDDFVYGFNENIEMGIAARLYRSRTYAGNGTDFNIEINEAQSWIFAITVGSLNPEITNVTEMYDVSLHLGHGVEGKGQVWNLRFVDGKLNGKQVKNYIWYEGSSPVITDSATDEEFRVTQMIQRYEFPFIKNYLPADTEYNEAGAPLGDFDIELRAVPKRKAADNKTLSVKTTVHVTKKV